jgi:pimeloyl-ACP methyl ester carboxylesterase
MQAVSSIASPPGQYWAWREHSIYYVKAGESPTQRPPLLLVHGFGASTDHWRKNLTGLGEDFDVWAIDLLGFGRSTKALVEYSPDLWRDQLADFISQVIGRPTIVVGNSIGAYAALLVGATRPEVTAGVVLLNSAGSFTQPEPLPPPDPLRSLIGTVTKSLFQQDWVSWLLFQYVRQRSFIRKTLERVYVDQSAVTEQLIEDLYRPACDVNADKVFALVFRSPKGAPLDVLLQQLSQPLLVLWGEGDPWVNARKRGAQFREFYPALTEYYLNAGHCPHDEIPDQVNQIIQAWVTERVEGDRLTEDTILDNRFDPSRFIG